MYKLLGVVKFHFLQQLSLCDLAKSLHELPHVLLLAVHPNKNVLISATVINNFFIVFSFIFKKDLGKLLQLQ